MPLQGSMSHNVTVTVRCYHDKLFSQLRLQNACVTNIYYKEHYCASGCLSSYIQKEVFVGNTVSFVAVSDHSTNLSISTNEAVV